jgi:serine phosphatase RsbU (regulator of sigma subunit)/putative methionine-R-sulfoxide reductase with GAF domain/ligand-binding sensor protein
MSVGFLKEFLASSDWHQMQDVLEKALDVPILWVDSSSGRSIFESDDRYPDLCQLIRENPECLRRCRNIHNARFQEVKRTGKLVLSACYCGLLGFALPLILDDKIIGVAGGCHYKAESPITMEKCAELSTGCGVDLKKVMELAKKIKHMPKIEQKRFLTTLGMYSDCLSLLLKWMNRLLVTLKFEDQYAARLSSLSEIVKLAASELNWQEMLKIITNKTKEVLDVDACSVYTLDQLNQELTLIATDGLPSSVIGRRIKVGEGITGHVAQTREAIAAEDAIRDPRSTTRGSKKPGVYQSILSVPLIAQDRLVGVIDARTFHLKKWGQTDIDFLSIIAEQIAGIVEKDKYRMEISRELEAARYIQARLLPDPLPDIRGYDLAALIVPNKQVGGDYYDFIKIDNGKTGIVIADVSGKGIGAAILMANTQGLVNAHARRESGTKEAVFSINNCLCESTEASKFVTMFYSILDVKNSLLTYTNAGHNYPFIYRPEVKSPKILNIGGMVLGMMENSVYSEDSVKLEIGDVIVLYSDGLTEARNKRGELFGEDRLHKIVYNYIEENSNSPNTKNLLDKIYREVLDFSASESLADDLTVVVFCYKG